MILEDGESFLIWRAAWIPFRFGSPMSRTIKSGFSAPAFWTACSPSEASDDLQFRSFSQRGTYELSEWLEVIDYQNADWRRFQVSSVFMVETQLRRDSC